MYYYLDKKSKKTIMYSEGKIKAPNFDEKFVRTKKEDKAKMRKNENDIFIKDNKIEFKLNEQGEYNKKNKK